MDGKKIFRKEQAYLIEAKHILEHGSDIELRRALVNVIYTCEEAMDIAKIVMKLNENLLNHVK